MPELTVDEELEVPANVEEEDFMDMSDEDFAKLDAPEADPEVVPVETPETVVETEETSTEVPDTEIGATPETDPASEPESTDTDTTLETESASSPGSDATSTVDYEAEYKKVMTPFKANGSEMAVQSTDDVVRLMQMGANYHRKMAGMKPSLKHLKLLEKNGLLDEEKLNYLIDLNNQNPEAITKLIKDSKIDPLDINVTEPTDYKPTQRPVSNEELTLDSVLEDLRESPNYQKTLNVITKDWDDSSRNTIANEPNIITAINGHMQDGTFDTVMQTVNYERSMGRLQGISDFQAYKQTGDTLFAEGKIGGQPPTQEVKPEAVVAPTEKTPVQKQADTERLERKKAAAPVAVSKAPAKVTFNPLEMSDAEFAKYDLNHFANK